ncbi:MAG: LytTR family transcriptional regulator DNA-binding domain-containing protein [Acutalibacteraceae bacterium]
MSKRKKVVIDVNSIVYILMKRKNAEIHISGGKVYVTRASLFQLSKELDDSFLEVRRGCVVSVKAIHNISKKVNLNNGESLDYTVRKKKELIKLLHEKQRRIINSFSGENAPTTTEQYRKVYSSFENMPFAFTDIEMVFSDESHAVDWIFRYGNDALSKLENIPIEKLIGNSFGSLFSNMDSKWLRCYERATLFGETLEIMDFSPEIDKYLKIICFPTFTGHCGCILFDINDIKFTKYSDDADKTLMNYFGMPMKTEN